MGISSSALDGLKPSPNDSPHDARKATIISEKMAEAATLGNSTIRRIQKKASVSGEGAGVGSNSSVNLRKPSAVSSTIDETPRESTYSYESSNSRSNATTMKGKSPFNIVSSKKQQQHQQPSASAAADAQIQQQKKTAAALAELDELDRVLADALNDL